MKILITGVNGQLGSQLREISFKDHEIIGLKKINLIFKIRNIAEKLFLKKNQIG